VSTLVTIVAIPELNVTSRFVEKSIVPAVPTADPLSLITTPVPDAVTPVSPDPSPTNPDAVTTPVALTPPVTLIPYPVVANFSLPL